MMTTKPMWAPPHCVVLSISGYCEWFLSSPQCSSCHTHSLSRWHKTRTFLPLVVSCPGEERKKCTDSVHCELGGCIDSYLQLNLTGVFTFSTSEYYMHCYQARKNPSNIRHCMYTIFEAFRQTLPHTTLT